jgi:hypothetical protein
MNIKHEQFIGIYEDAFSKEYCESVIDYFEKMVKAGCTLNRQQEMKNTLKSSKNDLFHFANDDPAISLNANSTLMRQFNEVFWGQCYADYASKFWNLKEFGPHSSYCFKIQKTEPGQGYHVWHSESTTRETCNRILAWSVYLNDIEEGGETEFINQHMRIKPKQGTVVIWPAGFTHTHRGNPPLSKTKYIVTGWVEL